MEKRAWSTEPHAAILGPQLWSEFGLVSWLGCWVGIMVGLWVGVMVLL